MLLGFGFPFRGKKPFCENLLIFLREYSIIDKLESARRYYNGTVKAFNIKIEVFPSSIVANSKRYEKKPYFELDSAEERKNVKVQF